MKLLSLHAHWYLLAPLTVIFQLHANKDLCVRGNQCCTVQYAVCRVYTTPVSPAVVVYTYIDVTAIWICIILSVIVGS